MYIWSWSYDFPNADDYSAILLPLIQYKQSPGFENLIAVIFEPHTQHLQVLLRVIAFIIWKFLGLLNFRVLIALGLLSIPVLIWMIGKLSDPEHKNLAFVLAFFAIAQPQYAEATLWATNAIPYLWVNVFAAASIYSRIKLNSYWSLLWAALCCLSWGNGILVPLICFLSPKSCNRGLRLSHVSLFGIFTYLHLSNPNTSGISRGIHDLPNIFLYFLRLVGSAPGYYHAAISLFFGILVVSASIFMVLKYRNHRIYNSPLFLFFIFLVGSLFLCAITRVSEGAFSAYTTSRYTLPSILSILVLILLLVEQTAEKKVLKLSLKFSLTAFAGLFWIYSISSYTGFMRQRYELLADSKARWEFFHSGLAGTSWESLNQIHTQAETEKIIPASDSARALQKASEIPISKSSGEAIVQIEYLLLSQNAFHISGYFIPTDLKMRGHKVSLLLKAEDGSRYSFDVEQRDRPDVVLHLGQVQPNIESVDERTAGFSVFADISKIPSARYSAYLIIVNSSNATRFDLQRTVEINEMNNFENQKSGTGLL
jgi:hypothetical protein